MPPAQFAPWASTVAATAKHLKTSVAKGLTTAAASKARAVHGPNELAKEDPTPLWRLVLEQFDDVLVKVLLAAAAVSFGLAYFGGDGDEGFAAFVEPAVIVLILVLNAVVGVWQESNAERALEALKELQSEHAKTYRDGALVPDLPAADLVPGDVVELVTGDRVPADLRLVACHSATVRLDQASLTGESDAVAKHADALCGAGDEIQAKECMLFSGTAVAAGSCVGIVTATGASTEIGRIHGAIADAAEEQDDTPLKKKLDAFGVTLTQVIGVVCLAVWLINYSHFVSFDDDGVRFSFSRCTYYFKIAVALAVAAIPEGLPTVITTCLALGTRKMVKKNAIVRKLPSVETLGCTTVICSDKTGTLTTNQMTVVALAHPSKKADQMVELEVTGTSYAPQGEVKGMGTPSAGLLNLSSVCALCNQAVIRYADGKYERVGEPTEAALKVLVEKVGLPGVDKPADPALACSAANSAFTDASPCNAVLEFSRDRKSMSTLCGYAGPGTQNELYCKGAPESVLPRCTAARLSDGSTVPLTEKARGAILKKVAEMASRPLRTLAMAIKEDCGPLSDYDGPGHKSAKLLADPSTFASVEAGMVFVGLCGIKDPARPEVGPAIAACATAGVRVVMITGDTKPTAEAIAREIGIFGKSERIEGRSFTGAEFFALPDEQKQTYLTAHRKSMVFSRTEPRDKQELVKILRASGEVPAMTGDGVNDAPALKQASIGIAMGIAGTEVAKEAADMVLADDNFATIVAAVEEGRSIYSNMKAFIRYLISSNIGEVASIFLTALLGLPEGLIPVQLLWVNLVTDGPPATALGFNPPDADIMKKPPRKSDDQLITPWVFFRYMVVGLYVGFATVGVFVYWYVWYDWSEYSQPLISYQHLANWGKCSHFAELFPTDKYAPNFAPWVANGGADYSKDPCAYLSGHGKDTASTLSLSVLVTIEMFNALNALSEDGSLLQLPPWANPYLLLAMAVSFGLHFVILYVPWLATIFSIVPLTWNDWMLTLVFSFPVIIIDEVLKFFGRWYQDRELKGRMKQD